MKFNFLVAVLLLSLLSCGKDKAGEIGSPSSVNELLDKLSVNLETFPPQQVGYQNVMQEETTIAYNDGNGTQIVCDSVETTTETIVEVRDDAVVVHRKTQVKNGPNNSPDCATASNRGPVLVLINREAKAQIMEEFRRSIDSGDVTLRGVTNIGNNRYVLSVSTVVEGMTVEASITIDFGVPYFMMNLGSSATATGFSSKVTSQRLGYNLNANTRGLNRRNLPVIDERE